MRDRRNFMLLLVSHFSYLFGLVVAGRGFVVLLKDLDISAAIFFAVCAAMFYVVQSAASEIDEPEEYILIEDYEEDDD